MEASGAWQEIGKSLGIIAGFLIVLGGMIKYLISDWFDKNKELQNLKQSNTDKLISKLETKVEELEKKLQTHSETLVAHTQQLKQTERAMNQILERVEQYASNTRETVNKLADLSHRRFNRIEESVPLKPKTKSVTEKFGKDSIIVKSVPTDDEEGDE